MDYQSPAHQRKPFHNVSFQYFLPGIVAVALALCFNDVSMAGGIQLPVTGQGFCTNQVGQTVNCANTGQDGEVQAGLAWPEPRFTDSANGTITDNLTGLTWLQNSDCFGRVNWSAALDAAMTLANGSCGLTDGSVAGDWRLPNIVELASLAHMGNVENLSWLGSFGFTGLSALGRWSSTPTLIGLPNAYLFQFRDRLMGLSQVSSTYVVWPVKGVSNGPSKLWQTGVSTCIGDTCAGTGQDGEIQAGEPWPNPRLKDNLNGTVTDNLTGLTWLKDMGCMASGSWQEAIDEAATLANGSCGLSDGSKSGDWRVPNVVEAFSLSDFSQASKLPEGHPFLNAPAIVWSSTSWPNYPERAFLQGFASWGQYMTISKADSWQGWAVRNAQTPKEEIFFDGFEAAVNTE